MVVCFVVAPAGSFWFCQIGINHLKYLRAGDPPVSFFKKTLQGYGKIQFIPDNAGEKV